MRKVKLVWLEARVTLVQMAQLVWLEQQVIPVLREKLVPQGQQDILALREKLVSLEVKEKPDYKEAKDNRAKKASKEKLVLQDILDLKVKWEQQVILAPRESKV